MIIKICGITNLEDARCAVELGADILGFNFYKGSVRYIEPQRAGEIIANIAGDRPGDIEMTGVFVDAGLDEILQVARLSGITIAQLHGSEDAVLCGAVKQQGLAVIKALRLGSREDVQQTGQYADSVDAVLLDAFNDRLYGGTGERFDWGWLEDALVQWPGVKIFLAGGINPDNVVEAMGLGCYGIDLCSGVEQSPGLKDHAKLRRLFEMVR